MTYPSRMAHDTDRKLHRDQSWLRILAGAATVWFAFNAVVFTLSFTTSPEQLAARYSEAQIAFLAALPLWSVALSGLAVAFGLLGSIAMYFRRDEAYGVYMLALLVAMAHLIDVISRGGFQVMAPGDAVAPISVMFFNFFLFWASYDARRTGHLREPGPGSLPLSA